MLRLSHSSGALGIKRKTESEVLLEDLCTRLGIPWEPIAVSTTATPDYRLNPRGHEIIAEVKQLEPNDQDRASEREILHGQVTARSYDPGKRVRQLITNAKAQIRSIAKDRCPGVLAIFNAVPFGPIYTDPMAILIAMYGQIQVRIALPEDLGQEPHVIGAHFGPKRSLSKVHNTSISAIALLYRAQDGSPGVNFYHNVFAARPLDPNLVRGPAVRHYSVGDASKGFEQWIEI